MSLPIKPDNIIMQLLIRAKIYLFERSTNERSDGRGWSGDNGMMLSAPAGNRNEALAISKELMKNWTHAPDFTN
jgi:hypothetical protein